MFILGLNAYHPDSSACIVCDGKLIAAVEEERFKRIKHWSGFPVESIRYCLREAGIDISKLDYVVFNRDPRANLFKKIMFALLNNMPQPLLSNRLSNAVQFFKIKSRLAQEFGVSQESIKAKVVCVEHHRSHLASSFFLSVFEKAAVVSLDGFGDFSSCMVARGISGRIDVLYGVNYPHSLGIFYTAFTQLLGFNKFGDEYKVMGLAAYGKPRFIDKMRKLLLLKPDGTYQLDLSYFSFFKATGGMTWDNTEPVLKQVFSKRLTDEFGPAREAHEEIGDYHCDIAASLQAVYEEAFFHVLRHAYEVTGFSSLCLSGGCALNSLANGKIFDNTKFKDIFIQPASSDSGGALGAAYYLYNQLLGNKRNFVMEHPFWGPSFSDEEIGSEIQSKTARLGDCVIEKLADDDVLCTRAARLISEGKVVGWFQGRVEIGPRALGNRSILADPRRPEMKDVLNARIKKREWFRPFAPSVLVEKVGQYFEKDYPDPFMLKVYMIRPDKRKVIPAVTHVDGTGRLQTVSKLENPLYWQLISEFEKITGVAVVLNTSFNENEPVVLSPGEALDCFLRTKMDALFLGHYLLYRKN